MSLRLEVVALLARTRTKNTASEASMRARAAQTRVEEPPTPEVLRIARVASSTVDGFDVLTVTPTSVASEAVLIYLHGGAYAGPMIRPHWSIIAGLIASSGAAVIVPRYGLAPEHSWAEAYELIDAVWPSTATVFLAGDSAGGALALGAAMRRRDAGLPSPAGILLFSPWVDATMTNPDIAAVVPRDPLLGVEGLRLAGRWWAAERDASDPLISPLYGELAGLPPVQVWQGGRDILAPDAKLLAVRIAEAGGSVDLHFLPRAFHVWVGIPFIPEAKAALREAGAFIRRLAG